MEGSSQLEKVNQECKERMGVMGVSAFASCMFLLTAEAIHQTFPLHKAVAMVLGTVLPFGVTLVLVWLMVKTFLTYRKKWKLEKELGL
ncbi:hypothetical protein [Bacillus cereus]|uniref:hypothetical protein n=1 Tax=Bacillus cereus TaxID=1396 RepID=UPI000BFD664C|nr:hypothetical protein [Bacillus cereus]PGR83553.1 hypothetical protein COC63_06095 [Bacillus cereus]